MTNAEEDEFNGYLERLLKVIAAVESQRSPEDTSPSSDEEEKALLKFCTYLTVEKGKTQEYALAVIFNAGITIGAIGDHLAESSEADIVREFENSPDWGVCE